MSSPEPPMPRELLLIQRAGVVLLLGGGAVALVRPLLGLALWSIGAIVFVVVNRLHRCMVLESEPFLPMRPLVYGGLAAVLLVFFGSLAIPGQFSGGRRGANESAAIATLKNLASAQAQCQASGAIDVDGDGIGEFGFFAELSGGVGVRTPEASRLSPPLLPGAFAKVITKHGYSGGVVERSRYVFQMYLPNAKRGAVPEAALGGVGGTPPDADAAERLWCCYAWPVAYGDSGRRAFFVNQDGEVFATDNRAQKYSGAAVVPKWNAALLRGVGVALSSSVAENATGMDAQRWGVVR